MNYRLKKKVCAFIGEQMFNDQVLKDAFAGKPEEPVVWRCQLAFHSISAVTIEWIPGHNGGFPQRFVIMYKRDIDDIWTYYDQFENETGTRQTLSVTLDDFLIGYMYDIRMYSTNLQGNSSASTSCLIAIPGNYNFKLRYKSLRSISQYV